jgi:hypothetical protein
MFELIDISLQDLIIGTIAAVRVKSMNLVYFVRYTSDYYSSQTNLSFKDSGNFSDNARATICQRMFFVGRAIYVQRATTLTNSFERMLSRPRP